MISIPNQLISKNNTNFEFSSRFVLFLFGDDRPQAKNCPLKGNLSVADSATAVWLCQTILQSKIKHNAHALCFAGADDRT